MGEILTRPEIDKDTSMLIALHMGITRMLGIPASTFQEGFFPGSKDMLSEMEQFVTRSKAGIVMCPIAGLLSTHLGPSTSHGGRPDFRKHIHALCVALSALEYVARSHKFDPRDSSEPVTVEIISSPSPANQTKANPGSNGALGKRKDDLSGSIEELNQEKKPDSPAECF